MITTLDLLNELRVKFQLVSDRKVAAHLGLTQSTVQKWRNGGTMSDEMAAEVAEMLELDVDFVLLAIIAERSKNQRAIKKLQAIIDKHDAA